MQAVSLSGHGGPDVLRWSTVPDPQPAAGEVVIDVEATAVNRADVLQRQGFYPPPPGAPETLGLECSGVIRTLGDGITQWSVGQPVCALLAGGGYAEQVAVPAGQVMPIPKGIDLVTAAALPEVACTVWSNLVMTAHLSSGDSFLVHGGSSGIGTMAIQVAAAIGAVNIVVTVGSEAKANACTEIGATTTINYNDEDFVRPTRDATGGEGVDVLLDTIGAKYLARNIDVLADDGRLVVIGMQGGIAAEIDLSALLRKRGTLFATSLRSRPLDQKAAICRAVADDLWPLIERKSVRPIVDSTYPMDAAADAHRHLESSAHIGKILLTRP